MTKVIYYTTKKGESPAKDFIGSLSASEKNKIARVITYIEEYGLIVAIRHVKKLTGTPLWEIRILGQKNIRILYATFEKEAVLILHGFIKKSQKTPSRELKTAINRLREWLTRKQLV